MIESNVSVDMDIKLQEHRAGNKGTYVKYQPVLYNRVGVIRGAQVVL